MKKAEKIFFYFYLSCLSFKCLCTYYPHKYRTQTTFYLMTIPLYTILYIFMYIFFLLLQLTQEFLRNARIPCTFMYLYYVRLIGKIYNLIENQFDWRKCNYVFFGDPLKRKIFGMFCFYFAYVFILNQLYIYNTH